MNEKTKGNLSANELQKELEQHISAMEKLIDDNMANNGDTAEECQKQHLLHQLLFVKEAKGGISREDMINDAENGIHNDSGSEKASHYGVNPDPGHWLGA